MREHREDRRWATGGIQKLCTGGYRKINMEWFMLKGRLEKKENMIYGKIVNNNRLFHKKIRRDGTENAKKR